MIVVDGKIWMVRGDDEVIDVSITDNSGAPYEMQSGDRLVLTVRAQPALDSPVIIQVESDTSSLNIRHEDTADVSPGAYSADIQLITAEGLRKTIWPQLEASNTRLSASNMRNFNIATEVTMI